MGQLRYLEARSSGSVRARGVVVLLHAFPLTARMWQPQLGALSERGWHVIAPEMASETMDDCAGDVIDLLDGLHVHDAVIGGCSMGGYLAFHVLRHAASYVRGLLLIDTRTQADAPEALEGRKRLIRLAEEQGPSAVLDDMIPKVLGDTTRRERTDVVDLVRSIGMDNSSAAIVRMVRVLMSVFFLGPLLFLAYGVLCVLAPQKHLAFNAWWNRRARRTWHEQRAYTTPCLRMERRSSQQTPANLWRIRITGIAFIGMSLSVMWMYLASHR